MIVKNSHSLTRLLLFALLATFNYGNANAQNIEDAVEAMRSGNFAIAYCIMRPIAEQGDADAQYNLGWMYVNGYGLRVNDSLALDWWKKASRQGHVDASFSIAMLYSLGEGEVRKDTNAAIDYYLKAADAGHEDALSILKFKIVSNDRFVDGRMHSIIRGRETQFGIERQVKTERLNARSEPTTESRVVGRLLKGDTVLELKKQGRWSQVIILGNEEIEQAVWVYNPLLVN